VSLERRRRGGSKPIGALDAGGVFTVGLAGTEIRAAERAALTDLAPAGVILFARNVESLSQLSALCGELDELLESPLLLIDQEGGRVDRLKGLVGPSPTARVLSAAGADLVRRHAALMARACRVAGLNFNCTPVVDLDEGNEGNAIGSRAWGSEPEPVVALAREVLEAHADWGVGACLKHFPGLGRTRADTHEMRPTVRLGREDLLGRELRPYAELASISPAVMVAHAAFAEISGGDRPASLSPEIVTGLLREELGYEGAVITDDLEMGAVTDLAAGPRAVAALEAGCDLLLFCHAIDEARAGRDAIAAQRAASPRLAEALGRVGRLREVFGGLPPGAGDENERAAISAELIALRREVDLSA